MRTGGISEERSSKMRSERERVGKMRERIMKDINSIPLG